MKNYLLILLTLLLLPVAVRAQDTALACDVNRNAPPVGSYYWPADSEVKVYFRSNTFTADQRRTLLEAMAIWNQASKRTGAEVKFTYAGDTDETITCQGCLTIVRAEIHKYNPKVYAFFVPLRIDGAGRLGLGEIQFDFKTTSPQALQGYMVHELGHGLGLWDCPTCKKKQSVMNGFPGVNKDNGLIAPSACDLEVVQQVYKAGRTQAKNVASRAAASSRK